MSLRSGLVSGLGSCLHSGLNSQESTGLNILADFDYRTPATVGVGGNGTFASAYATDEWLLQETSGAHANNVGSETLANTGGLQGQEAVGLFDGTNYTNRNAWESKVSNDKLSASGTTACDAGAADFGVRIGIRSPGWGTGGKYIVGKSQSGGGNPGWDILSKTGGGVDIRLRDGTNSGIVTLTGNYADGASHVVIAWFDWSTKTLYAKSDIDSEVSSATAIVTTLASTSGFAVGALHSAASGSSPKSQLFYAGFCGGANAQNFYNETVVLPGAQPATATQLTTVSRNSLISVPVSASRVAHFAGGTTPATCQLPIDWKAEHNGGAGGYGLYCNSAVTNVTTHSELFSGQWTVSSSTHQGVVASAPDGFYNASGFTPSGPGGFIYKNTGTVTINSEYTMSLWVKRGGGADVDGEIRLRDLTGATETAQPFTATSEWQLVSVQHTMGATATSGRNYIVGDSADQILVWGVQTNLGDSRGAYIRTNGSAASLLFGDYQVDSAAGALCKANKGEIETVHVAAFAAHVSGNGYLVDISNDTNNNDKRTIICDSNGRRARFYGWDSAAVAAFALYGVSAIDMSAQENTIVARWDDGGLLAAGGGEDGTMTQNGVAAASDIGTFSSADTSDNVQIGNYRSASNSYAPDASISRIRIWDGERV